MTQFPWSHHHHNRVQTAPLLRFKEALRTNDTTFSQITRAVRKHIHYFSDHATINAPDDSSRVMQKDIKRTRTYVTELRVLSFYF